MTALSMRRHRKRKLKAEINVVPYIDVMLVLLVIFMVTAPLLTLGVDVDLPQSNAKSVNAKEDPIVVSVYPDGTYALAVKAGKNETMTPQSLEARVRAIVSQNKDLRGRAGRRQIPGRDERYGAAPARQREEDRPDERSQDCRKQRRR
jgi:biopolymer transport protein TolR